MSITRTLILPAMLLLPAALPAQRSDSSFPAHDRNGDGVISRDEWRGNNRSFNQHDRNRDGILSGNELPGYRGRSGNNDPYYNEDRYPTQTRQRSGAPGAVRDLDKNRTGRVEGYEWPYNRELFHRLDTNGDSTLTADELRNIESATVSELDTNRNGRIDPDEWPGGFAQFDQLDQNQDGRVSSSEYFERGSAWQRRSRFDAWDTNRDGVIQSTEWKSAPNLFHRLDRNGNSQLEFDEFTSEAYLPSRYR